MKKLLTFFFALFLSVQIFAQSSPVLTIRIPDRTTAFGQNLPVETSIIVKSDSTRWTVKVPILGTATVTSAMASLYSDITKVTGTLPITVTGADGKRIVAINAATTTTAGSLSAVDKVKIDSIANNLALYERLANKSTTTTLGTSNILYSTQGAVKAYADGKVADAITDGVTTIAPSENAVYDALALKAPLASPALTGAPTAPTVGAGTSTTQLATTEFVQVAVRSSPGKEASQYATIAALPAVVYNNGTDGVGATLTGVAMGAIGINSGSPSVGQRVLVKNQVSTFQNGIYDVTATGSGIAVFVLTRSLDFNQQTDILTGAATYVVGGTTLAGTTWDVNSADSPVIGTNAITFVQSAGPGSVVAGNGIAITGTSIAINTAVTADLTSTQIMTGKTIDGVTPTVMGYVDPTSSIQTQLNSKQATLTNPVTGTGTTNYVSKFTGTSTLGNSVIYDNGNVGIGTTNPVAKLQVGAHFNTIPATTGLAVSNGKDIRIIDADGNANFGVYIRESYSGTSLITLGTRHSAVDTDGLTVTSGNVGIGTVFPTSLVHLAAGTTATAPLGFTSGSLLTTPVVGKVEFLSDAWYGTISTGAARKTFAFLESPTFTGTVTAPAIKLTTSPTEGYILKVHSDGSVYPDSPTASQVYNGAWDASSNTPTLADAVGTAGNYYHCTVAGAVDFDGAGGRAAVTFATTDDVAYNGSIWQKIANVQYQLLTASATVLGGIKIGAGITMTGDVASVSTAYDATGTASGLIATHAALTSANSVHGMGTSGTHADSYFSLQAGSTSLTTLGTVTTGTWNGGVIAGQYGGTGVANTGKTITLGGNLTTAGAYASTFTMTGTTGVTFPTSGTLATTAQTSIYICESSEISADGSTGSTVTLGHTPKNVSGVTVSQNGAELAYTSQFTVSGTTVTFAKQVYTYDKIICAYTY